MPKDHSYSNSYLVWLCDSPPLFRMIRIARLSRHLTQTLRVHLKSFGTPLWTPEMPVQWKQILEFLILLRYPIDFSDSLGRPKQHGFRAEPSEYGIQAVEREPETLMEVWINATTLPYSLSNQDTLELGHWWTRQIKDQAIRMFTKEVLSYWPSKLNVISSLQRYQRLKTEVAELASDVEQLQDGQQSSEKMLQVSPVDLAQDVRKESVFWSHSQIWI